MNVELLEHKSIVGDSFKQFQSFVELLFWFEIWFLQNFPHGDVDMVNGSLVSGYLLLLMFQCLFHVLHHFFRAVVVGLSEL